MSIEHSKEQDLQKAIKGYLEAAEVFKRSSSFLEHSRTLLLIGNAYLSLSRIRNPKKNSRLAIKAYEEALRTLTKKIIRRTTLRLKTALEKPTITLLNLKIKKTT